jgi:ethanolamine utilization cobalamin adenosyltransferase
MEEDVDGVINHPPGSPGNPFQWDDAEEMQNILDSSSDDDLQKISDQPQQTLPLSHTVDASNSSPSAPTTKKRVRIYILN